MCGFRGAVSIVCFSFYDMFSESREKHYAIYMVGWLIACIEWLVLKLCVFQAHHVVCGNLD